MLYLDSSALGKRYIREAGSDALNLRMRTALSANDSVITSMLTFAEIHAALARKLREGSLRAAEYQRATAEFQADWRTYISQIELSPQVLAGLPDLVNRYPLKGSDAAQLASAIWSGIATGSGPSGVTFASADRQLTAAAETERMSVFNPELG